MEKERIWFNDFETYEKSCEGLDNFKECYNKERMLSSLKYNSLRGFEKQGEL